MVDTVILLRRRTEILGRKADLLHEFGHYRVDAKRQEEMETRGDMRIVPPGFPVLDLARALPSAHTCAQGGTKVNPALLERIGHARSQ